MTIIFQRRTRLRSFPGGYAPMSRPDPALVAVGLVSLFGLGLSALAVFLSASVDLEPIAAFLG